MARGKRAKKVVRAAKKIKAEKKPKKKIIIVNKSSLAPKPTRKVWDYKKQIKLAKAEKERKLIEERFTKDLLTDLYLGNGVNYFDDEDDDGVVLEEDWEYDQKYGDVFGEEDWGDDFEDLPEYLQRDILWAQNLPDYIPEPDSYEFEDLPEDVQLGILRKNAAKRRQNETPQDIAKRRRLADEKRNNNMAALRKTPAGKAEIKKLADMEEKMRSTILKEAEANGDDDLTYTFNAQFAYTMQVGEHGVPIQKISSAKVKFDYDFQYDGKRIGPGEYTAVGNTIVPLLFYELAYADASRELNDSNVTITDISMMKLTLIDGGIAGTLDIKLRGTADDVKVFKEYYVKDTRGETKYKTGGQSRLAKAIANGLSLMDQTIDTGRGECVIDYMLWSMDKSDAKRNRKAFSKYTDGAKGRSTLIKDLGSTTPTGQEIIDFCSTRKISVHVLDALLLRCGMYIEKDNKHLKMSLCFIATNEHCYPVTDPEYVNSIIKYGKIKLGKLSADLHINESNSIPVVVKDIVKQFGKKKSKILLVKDTSDLAEIAVAVMRRTKVAVTKQVMSKTGMSMFEHPTTKQIVIAARDYDDRKAACETFSKLTGNMGLRWQNQSYAQIGNEFLKCIKGNIPESSYGPDLSWVYENHPINAYTEKVDYDGDMDEVVSIDIHRCYTGILLNNKYMWPQFSVNDGITVYEKPKNPVREKPVDTVDNSYMELSDNSHFFEDDDEDNGEVVMEVEEESRLAPGEYLVTKDFTFVKGNMKHTAGWKPYNLVDHALKCGYITHDDISHKITVRKALPHDYFVDFVNDVRKACPKNSKDIVNHVVGIMGKMWNREYFGAVTTSEQNAFALIVSHMINGKSDVTVCEIANMFVARLVTKEFIGKGNISIQRMVIAGAQIELDKLASELIGQDTIYLGIKTDSIQLVNPLPYSFKSEPVPGDLRLEERASLFKGANRKIKYDAQLPPSYVKEMEWLEEEADRRKPRNWKPKVFPLDDIRMGVDRGRSAMRLGPAGSGKTTELGRIHKEGINAIDSDEKEVFKAAEIAVLAFTNVAVQNLIKNEIPATTFHTFFGMHEEKRVDYKKLLKKKLIMVDEIGNTPSQFIHAMVLAKRAKPELVFRLYGDLRQCPPVEPIFYNLTKSAAIKYLVEGIFLPMEYNDKTGRYDKELHTVLNEFMKTKKWTHSGAHHDGAFFITKSRKLRDYLNGVAAAKYKPNKGKTVVMYDGNRGGVGMPVVSHRRLKTHNITNNETGVIVSISDRVTIKIGKKDHIMSYAECKQTFGLYFGANVHRLQGATLEKYTNIYEADKMSWNELYTAASRGKKLEYLGITEFTDKEYTMTAETENILVLKSIPTNEPAMVYKITSEEGVFIGSTTFKKGEKNKTLARASKEDMKTLGWSGDVEIIRVGTVYSKKQLMDITAFEIARTKCVNKKDAKPELDVPVIKHERVELILGDLTDDALYTKYSDDSRIKESSGWLRLTAERGAKVKKTRVYDGKDEENYAKRLVFMRILEKLDR